MAYQHQDARPTANAILKALTSAGSRNLASNNTSNLLAALKAQRRTSLTPTLGGGDTDGNVSHAYSIHNRDVSDSRSVKSSAASIKSQMTMSDCSALHPCSLPSPTRRDGSIATDDGESMLWISEADVVEPPPAADAEMAEANPAGQQVETATQSAAAAAAPTSEAADGTKASRRNSISAALMSKTRNAVKGLLPSHQKSREGLRHAAAAGAGSEMSDCGSEGARTTPTIPQGSSLGTPGSDVKHTDERRFSSLLRAGGGRKSLSEGRTGSPQQPPADPPASPRTRTSLLGLNSRFHRKRGSTIVAKPPEVHVEQPSGEEQAQPSTMSAPVSSSAVGNLGLQGLPTTGSDGDTMMVDAPTAAANESIVPPYPEPSSNVVDPETDPKTPTAATAASKISTSASAPVSTVKSRKRASTIERIGMTLGIGSRKEG